MAARNKRRAEAFDPTASDPEDLDYGAASSPLSRAQRRSKPSSSARPRKRQRKEGYGDTDEDVEDDDDSISEEGSFQANSEEEEEKVTLNPRTGRPSRTVTAKVVKYDETSEDDIEDSTSDQDEQLPARKSRKTTSRKSLIVRLKIPNLLTPTKARQSVEMTGERSKRSRTASGIIAGRVTKRGASVEMVRTRRSSRISHDLEAPLVALTGSGRHTQVTRAGTGTPEPPRATRASKGTKRPPSTIMEVSQETPDVLQSQHQPAEQAQGQEDIISQLQEAAGESGAEQNAQIQGSDVASDTQQDPELGTGVVEDVVEESVHEEGDDEDDEPVSRRNAG
ncbi:hypothetical protein LTR28_003625, partial [Elasticomyces elasticus]